MYSTSKPTGRGARHRGAVSSCSLTYLVRTVSPVRITPTDDSGQEGGLPGGSDVSRIGGDRVERSDWLISPFFYVQYRDYRLTTYKTLDQRGFVTVEGVGS